MMERSLLAAMIDGQRGGGQSILASMKYAVLPIAKVFTMCFMGFLMASKCVNNLPANGRKLLNGLVFSLLLPCLIFSQLGRAITLQKLLEWWYIPVNVIMSSLSGSLVGFLVASVVRPPYPYFKFTIIHIGIGSKSISYFIMKDVVMDYLNYVKKPMFHNFADWLVQLFCTQMLAPPPGETFDSIDEEKLPIKASGNSFVPEQVPLLTSEEPETTGPESSKRGKIIGRLYYLVEKLKIQQIFQPPIIASVLAIVIGTAPFLKHLILTDDAPFFFFTDSCLILGEAMIPCILLALGGNLVDDLRKRCFTSTRGLIIRARVNAVPIKKFLLFSSLGKPWSVAPWLH